VWPVKEIVDRLQRLSLAIRRAAAPNRHRRIEEFINDHEGYSTLSDAFERSIMRRLEDRYPGMAAVDGKALRFLGASIAWRRKRFLYLQSRKEQPGIKPQKELPPPVSVQPAMLLPDSVLQQLYLPQNKAEIIHQPGIPKTELLSEHTATTFDQEISKSETHSTRAPTIPTISVVQEKDFDRPPRPKGPGCPYCFDLLLDEELNEEVYWRFVIRYLAHYTRLTST
jgi:hypothetical protein